MKQIIQLLLFVTISSTVVAEVILLQAYDVGLSSGRLGRVTDPLELNDVVGLRIRLNIRVPSFPSYGYLTDSVALSMSFSGSGSLRVPELFNTNNELAGYGLNFNSAFDTYQYNSTGDPLINPVNGSGNIDRLSASSSSSPVTSSLYSSPSDILFSNILYKSEGSGLASLDLAAISGRWKYYTWGFNDEGFEWLDLTAESPWSGDNPILKGLVIHQVPEPCAIGLLALGGVSAMRIRRKL